MSVKETTYCTASCDACRVQAKMAWGELQQQFAAMREAHWYVLEEDSTCFCPSCMFIYRIVALAIIPEVFEGKDGAACGLKA